LGYNQEENRLLTLLRNTCVCGREREGKGEREKGRESEREDIREVCWGRGDSVNNKKIYHTKTRVYVY
jgi:hypothetical protein